MLPTHSIIKRVYTCNCYYLHVQQCTVYTVYKHGLKCLIVDIFINFTNIKIVAIL